MRALQGSHEEEELAALRAHILEPYDPGHIPLPLPVRANLFRYQGGENSMRKSQNSLVHLKDAMKVVVVQKEMCK